MKTVTLTRRGLGAALLAAPLATPLVARSAEAPLLLRASLDTAPTHTRNQAIADYLKKVEAASNGRIKTELFQSGQLFADRDILKALNQGQVEMGAPLTFAISPVVKDANLFELPALYGRSAAEVQAVIDGPIGAALDRQFEQKLRVKVLGSWLPNAFQNLFSTAQVPLNSYEDLRGRKVRVAGGTLQFKRLELIGAVPISVPWPDVPLAIAQGMFEVVATVDDSVAAGQLWDAGIKHAFEDHEELVEYVPIVSATFWNKLDAGQQAMMLRIWVENIGAYRSKTYAAAEVAVKTLASHGVQIVTPPAAMVAALRTRMLPHQAEWAKQVGISDEMVALLAKQLPAE